MILDANLEFCDAVDVSASAGTALVGDVVDLGAAAVNPGAGQPLYLVIQTTTAFASAGSAVVQFVLASDAAAALAADGTETRHLLSDAFAYTDLIAGHVQIYTLPAAPDYERYLGIEVITSGATTTAGSINAFLAWDVSKWRAYADATN